MEAIGWQKESIINRHGLKLAVLLRAAEPVEKGGGAGLAEEAVSGQSVLLPPLVIVCHGFTGSKEGGGGAWPWPINWPAVDLSPCFSILQVAARARGSGKRSPFRGRLMTSAPWSTGPGQKVTGGLSLTGAASAGPPFWLMPPLTGRLPPSAPGPPWRGRCGFSADLLQKG